MDTNERYKIIKVLRQNEKHIIYKAEDTESKKIVTLKILAADVLDDTFFIKALYSESLNTASLSHPNIIEVLDTGQIGSSQYIALEYLSGYDFMELIDRGTKFSSEQILFVMVKILKAMDYFHKKGVIHRDIKPHHIMLTADKKIKLIDFGLSILKEFGDHNAGEDIISGTSLYMSPEQIKGDVLDYSTDIYSFGATIFHIATQRPPFEGENIYYKHVYEPIPDIKDYNPNLPNFIKDTIEKCMDKDKERRFLSASEILSFLNRNS